MIIYEYGYIGISTTDMAIKWNMNIVHHLLQHDFAKIIRATTHFECVRLVNCHTLEPIGY
jgi:hypothetical protein